MIAVPQTDLQRSTCAKLMAMRCALRHSDETRYVCWISVASGAPRIAWCVAFEGWLGKTCRVHVAREAHASPYPPRKLIRAIFQYAFVQAKLELLIGVVDGSDKNVLRLDRWLGFEELLRLPGMHEQDHDLVVLGMYRHQCRWIREETHGRKERATCA